MGAYSSLATLGLNLALQQQAQRTKSKQLDKERKRQVDDILAADAVARDQQAAALTQRLAQERARLGASGIGVTGGSADAILQGLQQEGEAAAAAQAARTAGRVTDVAQGFDQRQRSDLLDYSNRWLNLGSGLLGGSTRSGTGATRSRSLLD